MANKQIYQFPNKPNPTLADLFILSDEANSHETVNSTGLQILNSIISPNISIASTQVSGLGTAATKNISNNSLLNVAGIRTTTIVGNLAEFDDVNGTITNGGFFPDVLNSSLQSTDGSVLFSQPGGPNTPVNLQVSGSSGTGGILSAVEWTATNLNTPTTIAALFTNYELVFTGFNVLSSTSDFTVAKNGGNHIVTTSNLTGAQLYTVNAVFSCTTALTSARFSIIMGVNGTTIPDTQSVCTFSNGVIPYNTQVNLPSGISTVNFYITALDTTGDVICTNATVSLFNLTSAGGGATPVNTDGIPEGTTNLYLSTDGGATSLALLPANNLSDLSDMVTAVTNLGIPNTSLTLTDADVVSGSINIGPVIPEFINATFNSIPNVSLIFAIPTIQPCITPLIQNNGTQDLFVSYFNSGGSGVFLTAGWSAHVVITGSKLTLNSYPATTDGLPQGVNNLYVSTNGVYPPIFRAFNTISGGTLTFNMIANNFYISNTVARCQYSLPSAPVGTIVGLSGIGGSGGWKLFQASGQQIQIGSSTSTLGNSGYVQSSDPTDGVTLMHAGSDFWFSLPGVQGTLTIV